MNEPKKKLTLKFKSKAEHVTNKKETVPNTRRRKLRLGGAHRLNIDHELDTLSQAFDVFIQNLDSMHTQITPDKRISVINRLFGYYQKIHTAIQKINQGVTHDRELIGNLANQMHHKDDDSNKIYEINNEITLLNFGETHLGNIIDLFSDPDFINHIIRKDTFKNKYSVVVYDKKWDQKSGQLLDEEDIAASVQADIRRKMEQK